MLEVNKIYNGDCLEVMDKLIDEEVIVDAIITDPPYGTTACKWDSVIPFDKMWLRLNKLIKPNGAIVLFGSEPFSSALRMSNIKNYKYDWVWKKSRPSGISQAKYQPMKNHENIMIFAKNKTLFNPQKETRQYKGENSSRKVWATWNTGNNHGLNKTDKKVISEKRNPTTVLSFPSLSPFPKGSISHPTQKPVALMEYLIKTYTNEGELVLDFTIGSGTTAIACLNTNRNFIGIELDKGYFEIAKKRIEEHKLKEVQQCWK